MNMSIPKFLQEAIAHQQAGRLFQAEAIYLQILQAEPEHPDALHLLGMVAHQASRDEVAVELIVRAIRVRPSEAMYHNNLGMALETQGKLDAAAESLGKALLFKPGYAKAHYNLGSVLQTQGKLDAAVESYHNAISFQPNYAEAHYNLGKAHKDQGKPGAAVEHYKIAITLRPDYVEAHNNLGNVLNSQDKLDEAIKHYHKALSIKPDYAEPYSSLGNIFQTLGRLDEAVEHYRKALSIKPDLAEAFSSLLFLHGYHVSLDHQEYLSLARGWEQACVPAPDRQAARERTFQRPPPAGRRLRVGYVSGDYRQHAVSYFIEQLFAQHDRARIELFAYSTSGMQDAVTERLQALVDHWIPIKGISDIAFSDRIEMDGIDVLVDLSGHTHHNRLAVFARRAAPVQAHYLGYFASTGLTEMDYFIGDGILTPPESDSHFCEQVWRLPRIRASYEGTSDAPLPDWHPAQDGSVWLGSFNNLGKLTPATLALWAKVLHALPEARLLLKTKELADASNRRRILDAMDSHGISSDRIELQDRNVTPGWREHMAYYNRLDIVLDSVGAHGGYTTTCDALWMGVPVIALEGERMASCMAASILNAIGHPEWVARDEAEYIDKVIVLARDVEQRKALRSIQRKQMASSPLCDAKDLAKSLENAYFEMFERWLKKVMGSHQNHKEYLSKVIQEAIEHHQAGRLSQADALCRQILQIEPDHPVALHLLGVVAHQLGRNEIAVDLIGKAIKVNPSDPAYYNNLGMALEMQGKLGEAAESFRKALLLKPGYATAHYNLGNIFRMQGKLDAAVESYQNAISCQPYYAAAHNNLGAVLQDQGKLDEAIKHCCKVLSIKPDCAEAYCNLGNALTDQGKLDEAAEHYNKALSIKPDYADAHSNLLFCLSHNEGLSAQALFAEHASFGEQFEAPLRAHWPQHTNSRDPERRLQIGFVSGDLRFHAVANFIEPVLAHLSDYPHLSLHAYANHAADDSTTRRLREHFAYWYPVAGLPDAVLAQKIRDDGIDIMIDLSGHTARNCLLAFARKPAPVQVSWMGYPGTTGLRAMDYYLADRFLLPAQFDDQYTEKIVRLPASAPFLPSKDAPPVNALPALVNGYVTFGSFNRLSKLSPSVIALWSKLLRALPDSRMVLGGLPEDGGYDELIEWFLQEGIDRERLSFHGRCGMGVYLGLHHRVDICLDTFPYNGGTTTLHALWMGVPTLTLAGSTTAGRTGATILGHVGLEAFVAHDAANFIQKGLSWADNLAVLSGIRSGLRERFLQSAMGQPPVVAVGVERALRIMWQRWCAGLPAESFEVPLQDINDMKCEADIQAALEHHQAGRLPQAEALYRQILQTEPDHPDALHFLGTLAHEVGRNEIAVELIGKVLALKPDFVEAHNNIGLALHEQGKLAEAIEHYQKALSLRPDYADAHSNLGFTLQAQSKLGEAVEHYRQALSLKPDSETHNNLGVAHKEQGKLEAALDHLHKALLLRPDYAEAHYNLGNVLKAQNKLEAAVGSYLKAVSCQPDYAEAHNNLGIALKAQGKLEAAVKHYRKALSIKPNFVDALNNLGIAFKEQGKLDEAIESYCKALSIKPDYAETYNNFGLVLQVQDKLNAAIESYRQALLLRPDYADALNNLGHALQTQGKLDEAVEHYRKALSIKPDLAEAQCNLGGVFRAQGKLDDAVMHYRKALSHKPDYAEAHSNLLFLHGYHASLDPHEYLALARAWEQACVPTKDRQLAQDRVFQRPTLAGRRLRVGYVSGDFRKHAVSYFIEQLFAHHDRARIELFAYSANVMRDAVTERMHALVDHWIPVVGMSDVEVLDRIESDGIDVLIDLSGHTALNRMGVFARRAAPVQAHYLGYFASTGLTEMDYLIGDEILTQPETDSHFCEQVWRLPRIRASYEGKADAPLPDWHPAQDDSIWLGSFNNLGKLTPATLALWAKALHALPEGKLLLKTKDLADAENRRRILVVMDSHGIAADRIELLDGSTTPGWSAHMAYYDRLDIALDPVGAHGGYTTTCDALWMGVPVITFEGERMASRMAASILDAIGHPEWVARSEAEYVDKVVALARDVEQRKELRSVQRDHMASSPLCDAEDLAMSLENAYFEMFERWLKKQNGRLSQG